jgi:hypothetical protein
MVPAFGGTLTWIPATNVPVAPQKTPTVPDASRVSAFTVLPVYAATAGLKLLPQVSIWRMPPWGSVNAYQTDAPPGPGSPASVVAFTFVPVTVPVPPVMTCALAKLSLAGARLALGVTELDAGEGRLLPAALVATTVNV